MKSISLVYGLILGILVVFAFTLGFHVTEVGAVDTNATDTIAVAIWINEKCIVDISPALLNWSTPIDPGSESVEGYKSIQIENMGSVNLTHVWFNNSYPSSKPFGTGLSTAYDSGNFMVISNNTGGQTYFFPNRVDYNETTPVIYLRGPGGNVPPVVPYGRFRNSSREYFWAVTLTGSNYTDGTFYISDTAHTQTVTGADLQNDASNVVLNTVTDGPEAGDWGYGAINIAGSMAICVAMYHDASKAMFYKYNMDAPGAESCSNAKYFINATTEEAIVPGASGYARIAPYIPYGVVYNETNPEILGTITVLVNTI